MAASFGTAVFWMMSLGLISGAVAYLLFGKRGMDLASSLITGAAGAIVTGILVLFLNLPGAMPISIIGSISILFIATVFRQKEGKSGINTANS